MDSALKEKARPRSWRSLGKVEILRGHKTFSEILAKGTRFQGTYIRSYILPVDWEFNRGVRVRVGFGVNRQVKSAANRNRVRRLMREAYRLNKERLVRFARERQRYFSIVFLFKENKETDISKLGLRDIEKDIQRSLDTALTTR